MLKSFARGNNGQTARTGLCGSVSSGLVRATSLISPLVQYLFFAVCIAGNLDYEQLSNRGIYSLVCIFLCLVCFACLIKVLVVDKTSLEKRVWLFLCLSGLICVNLVLTNQGYHQYEYLENFLVFGGTGICAGLYFKNDDRVGSIACVLDVIMIFCLAGASLFELSQYSASVWAVRGYANLSYQNISYMAALAFALDLWSLVFARPESYPSFLRGPIVRLARFILLFLSLVTILLSGGRGGVLAAVAVCASILVLLWEKKRLGAKTVFFLLAVMVMLLLVLFVNLDALSNFRGFERIVTRGDNRSDVWDMAIAAFAESPVFGYGFGGYGAAFDGLYPHNIVLDALLSAGLVGLFSLVILCVYITKRIGLILRRNPEWGGFLLMIGMFSAAYLSVSGTFVSYAPFWFFLAAVIAYQEVPSEEDAFQDVRG